MQFQQSTQLQRQTLPALAQKALLSGNIQRNHSGQFCDPFRLLAYSVEEFLKLAALRNIQYGQKFFCEVNHVRFHKMLKAIHAQESKKDAREKAKAVVAQLREMKLKEAAKKVEDSVEETLTYCDFPYEHWTRIRTNNVIERLNREIRRRTRVVGTFRDRRKFCVIDVPRQYENLRLSQE